jgi:hypothetical protein
MLNTATPPASNLRGEYHLGYIWLISAVAAMGGLLFGWDWVVIGGAKPFFQRYFQLSSEAQIGWANSCALIGCLFGSLAAGALSEMLPRSLVDSVRALAAREGCATDLQLVDLVRTETFARLRRLDEGAPILEMPVLEAPELSSVEVMPEPEPEPVSTKEEAPKGAATDTRVIDEVSRTLDQMADNIEKVMQLVGETGRSKGPQGELTDLFLSTSGEVVGLGELSPTERLFQRAQELNERLTALVALTRRERKPRASKSTRASTEENAEPTPTG